MKSFAHISAAILIAATIIGCQKNSDGGGASLYPTSIPADINFEQEPSQKLTADQEREIISLLKGRVSGLAQIKYYALPNASETAEQKKAREESVQNLSKPLKDLYYNIVNYCQVTPISYFSSYKEGMAIEPGTTTTDGMNGSIAGANCPILILENTNGRTTVLEFSSNRQYKVNRHATKQKEMNFKSVDINKAHSLQIESWGIMSGNLDGQNHQGYERLSGQFTLTLTDGKSLIMQMKGESLSSSSGQNNYKFKRIAHYSFQHKGVAYKISFLGSLGTDNPKDEFKMKLNGHDLEDSDYQFRGLYYDLFQF